MPAHGGRRAPSDPVNGVDAARGRANAPIPMKLPVFSAAVFSALLLSACVVDPNGNIVIPSGNQPQNPGGPGWGQPPADGGFGYDSIVESPGGSRFRYQDNHGRYTVTLFPGGRYRFVSISQNESMADTQEGRWSWRRSGRNQGELRLGPESWYLRFFSPDRAEATTSGDMRTYSFTFERL